MMKMNWNGVADESQSWIEEVGNSYFPSTFKAYLFSRLHGWAYLAVPSK